MSLHHYYNPLSVNNPKNPKAIQHDFQKRIGQDPVRPCQPLITKIIQEHFKRNWIWIYYSALGDSKEGISLSYESVQ